VEIVASDVDDENKQAGKKKEEEHGI